MTMNDARAHYTVSIQYDRRLYKQDIAGSVAHARMLARQGVIESAEANVIIEGLEASEHRNRGPPLHFD